MISDEIQSEVKCEICKDTGLIINSTGTGAAICPCVEQRALEKRLEFAKVPEELKDITINSFRLDYYSKSKTDVLMGETYYQLAKKAKTVAVNYIKNFEVMREKGMGLYIYFKTPGTGKSRLAVGVLNALIKTKKQRGIFVVVNNLLKEIQYTFNKDSEHTTSELINAVKNIDIAVFDDIGVETSSSWVKQELYSILNDRMLNKKITIFTSNCSIDELKHGERITSRIKSITYPVYLAGDDNREKIAKDRDDNDLKLLLEG